MKRMTLSIDEKLIQGLIEEDNKSINEIYNTCFDVINNYITSNNGDENDAKDVFQETVLVLFDKAKNKTLTLTCSLSTYMYSIARFIWLKKLDRKKRDPVVLMEVKEDALIDEDTLDIYIRNLRFSLIYKIFKQLSKDCQKLLDLFLEGRSINEVTKIMNYASVQHTKNRRYRCKKNLVTKIWSNPIFKEIKNEYYCANNEIPRW